MRIPAGTQAAEFHRALPFVADLLASWWSWCRGGFAACLVWTAGYSGVVSVTLEIPDDFAQRLRTEPGAAEAQLHLELAIALYRQGQLPPGRAAEIAGRNQREFEEILRQRQVPMPYSLSDLEHDVAYARGRR